MMTFKSLRWVCQDRIVKRGPGPHDHTLESPTLAMFSYASDLDDIWAIGVRHDELVEANKELENEVARLKAQVDEMHLAQILLQEDLQARNAQIDRLTEQVETAAAVINVKHGDWMGVIQRLAAGRGFTIVVDPDEEAGK